MKRLLAFVTCCIVTFPVIAGMTKARTAELAQALGAHAKLRIEAEVLQRELDARRTGETDRSPALKMFTDAEVLEALLSRTRAIYGKDNRSEVRLITDANMRQNARATGMLVDALDYGRGMIREEPDGSWRVLPKKFTAFRGNELCHSVKYYSQDKAAACTVFLVRPNVVATAGHCVKNACDLEEVRVVFGYEIDAVGNAPGSLPANQVYRATSLIKGASIFEHHAKVAEKDWAIITLDRNVTDTIPVTIADPANISAGESLYMIGYPSGIPEKYASDAQVLEERKPGSKEPEPVGPRFFRTNLDAFHGNSGAPVFNSKHEVEGILIKGNEDFVVSTDPVDTPKGCWTTHKCPQVPATKHDPNDPCSGGELVLRMRVFESQIPN